MNTYEYFKFSSLLHVYVHAIYSRLPLSRIPRESLKHRDIRTSTYQSWESEENNKLNNHI